jgi:hypothetical protein
VHIRDPRADEFWECKRVDEMIQAPRFAQERESRQTAANQAEYDNGNQNSNAA